MIGKICYNDKSETSVFHSESGIDCTLVFLSSGKCCLLVKMRKRFVVNSFHFKCYSASFYSGVFYGVFAVRQTKTNH